MSAEFWAALQDKWDLNSVSVYKNIEEPVVPEEVDPELFHGLMATVHKNPAGRDTTRFVKFCEYASGMNATELYGALQGCRPQVNLHDKHRVEMEHVLLGFIADHGLHLEHTHIWERVKDHFEVVLKQKWLDLSGIGRKAFLLTNAAALEIWINRDAMTRVEDALAAQGEPLLEDLVACMSSLLGASLYAQQGAKLQWLPHIDSISKNPLAMRPL